MEDKIVEWSMAVTAQIGAMQSRETMLANAAKIAELQHYLIGKMKERENEPREDMISDIVHAEVTNADGTAEKLTFEEAVSLIRAMLIAGNDTTATAIGNLFYVLATKPGMAETLDEAWPGRTPHEPLRRGASAQRAAGARALADGDPRKSRSTAR